MRYSHLYLPVILYGIIKNRFVNITFLWQYFVLLIKTGGVKRLDDERNCFPTTKRYTFTQGNFINKLDAGNKTRVSINIWLMLRKYFNIIKRVVMLKCTVVFTLSIVFFLGLPGCATSSMADRSQVNRPEEKPAPERPKTPSSTPVGVNYGKAAYYANDSRGKITASGEAYDPAKLTAAHVSLPFGSICRVTNMTNGKTVEVRVNDRFSGTRGRIILLSYEAANRLDAIRAGVIEVKVEVLKTPNY